LTPGGYGFQGQTCDLKFVMGEVEAFVIPQFSPLQSAFEAVQSGSTKPIAFISLGTK
jgi:hypothetical protein